MRYVQFPILYILCYFYVLHTIRKKAINVAFGMFFLQDNELKLNLSILGSSLFLLLNFINLSKLNLSKIMQIRHNMGFTGYICH